VATSILTSVKKTLGLEEADTSFDADILVFINSTFSTLHQLGVGPENGFQIEDKVVTWDAFLGTDPRLNNVKAYMHLKVRMLFDPPTTSFAIDAMNQIAKETEWRISERREEATWVDPESEIPPSGGGILDGGQP
jgi:hypothetical protein